MREVSDDLSSLNRLLDDAHRSRCRPEGKLPEGFVLYHGLEDAALRAGLSMGGRTMLRVIVRALAQDETVQAIGKGHLNEMQGTSSLRPTASSFSQDPALDQSASLVPAVCPSRHLRWASEPPERPLGSSCPSPNRDFTTRPRGRPRPRQ
jgi:hypothetical protein